VKEYTPITIPEDNTKVQFEFDNKDRTIENGYSIKQREWKIFVFQTPEIPNSILIDNDGERIELHR